MSCSMKPLLFFKFAMEWRFSLAFFADGMVLGRLFRFALIAIDSVSTDLLGLALIFFADLFGVASVTFSLCNACTTGVFGVFGDFDVLGVFGYNLKKKKLKHLTLSSKMRHLNSNIWSVPSLSVWISFHYHFLHYLQFQLRLCPFYWMRLWLLNVRLFVQSLHYRNSHASKYIHRQNYPNR